MVVTDCELGHVLAHCRHHAGELVAGYAREFDGAQDARHVASSEREVGVAYATVFHVDQNILVSNSPPHEVRRLEITLHGLSRHAKRLGGVLFAGILQNLSLGGHGRLLDTLQKVRRAARGQSDFETELDWTTRVLKTSWARSSRECLK